MRLLWVDAIKGFAIILMVMGHVLAWMFSDCHVIKIEPTPSCLWQIIYSFHMPLLMFMSGLLFGLKPVQSADAYLKLVWKKFVVLMVPYFVAGFLCHAYRGGSRFEYWYLGTLFELVVLLGLEQCVVARYVRGKWTIVADLVAVGIFWVTIWCGIRFLATHPSVTSHVCGIQYLRLGNLLRMLLPFCVGLMIAKYGVLEKVTGRVWAFGCLFAYLIVFGSHLPHRLELCKWLALFGFLSLFKLYFQSGRIMSAVRYCGKMSMAIYVFHFFLTKIFKFPSVGEWFCGFVQRYGTLGILASIPMQLVYSLSLSVVIIVCCLIAERVVERIPVLRTLLLGKIGWRGA